jgi:fructan beta-fructosidase
MTVALPTQRKVAFYASDDLKAWSKLSEFGPAGATGGIWECPFLMQVPVEGRPGERRWVLQVDLNPGSIAGGSGGQYFVGDFDGTTFTAAEGVVEGAPHWVDYGPDYYAAIPWLNVPEDDGRALWIGWMNNWAYAQDIPTSPWRSAQSLPRAMQVRTVDGAPRLVQRPVEELHVLRGERVELAARDLAAGAAVDLRPDGVAGTTLEVLAEFEPGDAATVGLHVRTGENGERTVIGYDAAGDSVFVDRRASGEVGFHEAFAARDAAPLAEREGRVRLHVFVDRSSVEVFANDGARVLTHRVFPAPESDGVALFAEGGTARLARLEAWALDSIWDDR